MDTNILQQIKEQYDRNFPFVIYRKPRQKEIVLLLQTDDNCYKDDNLGQAGFAMAPFDNSLETVLIPLHKATLYRFPIDGTNEVKNKYSFKENKQEYRQDYIAKLQETIGAIRDGDLQKIVFSRKEVLNIESLDILQTFQNLVTAYPLAMVYCWYHPNYGVWLGATPETLFTYKQGYFATMALAGTRKLSKNRNTPWGIKELEEQKMVTDYIVKQLQKQQIKSTIGKLETVVAGKIEHLRTNIGGKLSAEQVTKLIQALHPTPAICGVPLRQAKEFILAHETYARSFYTGYLGEVFIEDNAVELFVNLRCMSVVENETALYVGGGITGASKAEYEWEETVIKAQTIKNVL